jgi:hypothetical protein
MAKTAKSKKVLLWPAKFEQILLEADGPQIILLSSAGDTKIIAVAVDEEGYDYPFFGAQVTIEQFEEYLSQRFDLRYLMLRSKFKRHYLFDFGSLHGPEVSMLSVKLNPQNEERYLPDHGFFAREHTHSYMRHVARPQTEQIFGVDGAWDLSEFSHFYGQISDIYAFYNSVDVFLDDQISQDQKSRVKGAFLKPFQGGGSYLSLYDSLAAVQTKSNRLHVGGISYNSPGYVKIKGAAKPFLEIRELLAHLDTNSALITAGYNSLRSYLVQQKLLALPAEKFDLTSDVAKTVEAKTIDFAEILGAVEYEVIDKMSDKNGLVAAKVLLSLYRRAMRLHEFFLEGRASLKPV